MYVCVSICRVCWKSCANDSHTRCLVLVSLWVDFNDVFFVFLEVVLFIQATLVYSVGVNVPASSSTTVLDRKTLLSQSVSVSLVILRHMVVSERVSGGLRPPGMMGEGVYVCKYILHTHILTVDCVSIYIRTYVRTYVYRVSVWMVTCITVCKVSENCTTYECILKQRPDLEFLSPSGWVSCVAGPKKEVYVTGRTPCGKLHDAITCYW